jgi:DNA repair protein RecO (recombination protein O)
LLLSSKGLVLKVFPYSNTSVICNIFTDDYGKLTFIVKGIRKPKKPLLSVLQPFNLIELQYYYKKDRGIQLIKEADIVISFERLRNNFSTIIIGSTILNIINKVFEKEYSNEIIFRLIYKILNKLSHIDAHNKIYFIFFIFHLNKQLGFMPTVNEVKNAIADDGALFLDQINETHIDKLLDIDINSNLLKKTYNFLIFFMKCHIHSMSNMKGLEQIEKIYNDK